MFKKIFSKKALASIMAAMIGLSVFGGTMTAEAYPPPPPPHHYHHHNPPPPPPPSYDDGYDGGDLAIAAILGIAIGAAVANS